MLGRNRIAATLLKATAVPVALTALAAQPVAAQQMSEGYEFLKAVKERDGDKVIDALNQPGNTLINTRDIATGRTAMHNVTERRDANWIAFLAAKGGDPDVADKRGVTPLQIATQLGYIEGIEALLKAGVRVDQANSSGETPLISAIHRRDTAMIRILLKNGASPDRTDNSGRSARDYAKLMVGGGPVLQEIAQADADRANKGADKTYGPSL